eukprot:6028-Prymnesium_polylepis.1
MDGSLNASVFAPRLKNSIRFVNRCIGKCVAVKNASNEYLAGCDMRCHRLAKSYAAGDAKRDTVRQLAALEAQIALQRMRLEDRLQRKRVLRVKEVGGATFSICNRVALLPNASSEVVRATVGKPWRYFSLIE